MNNDQFVPELYRPTPEKPWIIKEVFIDLDGTMVGSYQAFQSLVLLASFFSNQPGVAQNQSEVLESLITLVQNENLIQSLLHEPQETIEALAQQYAKISGIGLDEPFSIDKVDGLRQNIEDSFKPFSELITFLERLHKAGIPLRIYTNTGPKNTAERLVKMGVSPELVTEIYSRVPDGKPVIVSEWGDAAAEFAGKITPYDYSKPSPEPFLNAQQRGIAPENQLYIGEGLADLGCALDDPDVLNQFSRFHVRFAFQLAGATATEMAADLNNRLRAGHPIGVKHFNEQYPEAEDHPGILPLRRGFPKLIEMLDERSIVLKPQAPAPV